MSTPAASQPFVKLNDGRMMPQMGLGTWKSEPGQVKTAVKHAVLKGYRHIDCAAVYNNESEVGEALAELVAEGVVKRSDLWVTSKLWNDSHRAEDVPVALAKTLDRLRLDYVDLYLIHWPVVSGCDGTTLEPSTAETWAAMEAQRADKKCLSIGVSNFSARKLKDMEGYAKVFPAVNQVELHPKWQQTDLLAACATLGTHVTAYSPLGSGDSASLIKHDGASVMKLEVITTIAGDLSKTPAQVLVRWAVQRGTSVIPKSVNPGRIEGNFDIFTWELNDQQMAAISAVGPQQRLLHGRFWCSDTGPYKTTADLWDE